MITIDPKNISSFQFSSEAKILIVHFESGYSFKLVPNQTTFELIDTHKNDYYQLYVTKDSIEIESVDPQFKQKLIDAQLNLLNYDSKRN